MRLSRRAVLAGSAGVSVALVAGCGSPSVAGRLVSGSFHSRSMRGSVGYTTYYPRGHAPGDHLPVVVSLHGKGGDHNSTFHELGLGGVVDQLVRSGVRPFVLASVDGGADSYYHRRADGTDAGAMVRDELVPRLHHEGLDTARLGYYGWSMGGYGALLLAATHHPPVRAVAVSSPALFTAAGLTAAGAFDSPEDFDRNDVYAHPEWLRGIPLRIDIGTADPFYPATKSFVARLHPRPAGGFESGGHDDAFWRTVAPAQLHFLARHLG